MKKAVIGVCILFCGMVIGGGSTVFIGKKFVTSIMENSERTQARLVNKLQRKLDLSTEQTGQFTEIINQRLAAVCLLRKEFQSGLLEQFDLLYVEGAAVLDTKQQAEWKKKMDRVRKWSPVLAAPNQKEQK